MITCSYWSLNKQRVSLGVFDKCCLLANFLQENGRYEMIQRSWTIGIVSSILRHSVDQLNLDTKKTQVRICWIYRSHRGQGWLDTHILLRGLLDFKSLNLKKSIQRMWGLQYQSGFWFDWIWFLVVNLIWFLVVNFDDFFNCISASWRVLWSIQVPLWILPALA